MYLLQKIGDFLAYWYLQYILTTSLYMLEPAERRVFTCLSAWYLKYSLFIPVYMLDPTEACIVNALLVALIAMCVYTSYLFLPGHAIMLYNFIKYMLGLVPEEHPLGSGHPTSV